MENKLKLIVTRGLPGSGKSTCAKKISKETGAILLDVDDYRMKICNSIYNEDDEPYIWSQVLKDMLFYLINENRSVIICESNTSLHCLLYWIEPVEKLNIDITILNVITDTLTCKSRRPDFFMSVIDRKLKNACKHEELVRFCKERNLNLIDVKGE